MASVAKQIEKAVRNNGGRIRAPHHVIMAELRLTGCNRVKLNEALDALENSGKVTVAKTETHTTITRC